MQLSKLRKIHVAAMILALAPLSPPSPGHSAPALPFGRIVVFGDSLSDPGNAYLASGEFLVPPFDDGFEGPAPQAPYGVGAFHFSNGATWIEWLGREVRLYTSTRPALRRPGVYSNYAIGAAMPDPGARARNQVGPPNLASEIDAFLDDFGSVPPKSLVVIWIGANDLFDALSVLPDQVAAGQIIGAALLATGQGIQTLCFAGASSFLVLNLPDLAITPAVIAQGPVAQAAAEALSTAYNDGLEAVLVGLEPLNCNDDPIDIARMDVFTILNDAVANPTSVGLTNVTDSCISLGFSPPICSHPHTHLFWDFIHPTTEAHRLLSREAETMLMDAFAAP